MTAASRLHQRVSLLEDTLRLLRYISEQIRYTARPLLPLLESIRHTDGLPYYLPQICLKLKQGKSPKQAFGETIDRSPYAPSDVAVLRHCTERLGQTDVQGQSELLQTTCRQLEENLEQARRDAIAKGRMFRMLGSCCGAALVLLFL